MARAQESIEIRVPRAQVFAAVTDPRRTMEWNTNIVEMRDLSEYPARQGTSWSQTAMVLGKAMQLRCRVAQWQPPQLGVLDISGAQKATVTTECQDLGGTTRVVQTIDFTPPGGVLGSLAKNLIAKQIQGELARSLQLQRDTLEREWRISNGSRPA